MNEQRLDILLTRDGDMYIDEWGDLRLTESVRQAVRVRLQWFFNEWRFAPQYGVPYFEDILIKNPDTERIRRIVRDEVMSVDMVLEARNITIRVDNQARAALIALVIVVGEETYREEVTIPWGTYTD